MYSGRPAWSSADVESGKATPRRRLCPLVGGRPFFADCGCDRHRNTRYDVRRGFFNSLMSDHYPLWVELDIDFTEDYLDRLIS